MIRVIGKDREVIKSHITIETSNDEYPPDIYEIAIHPYMPISLKDFASESAYSELKKQTEVVRLVYEYQESVNKRFHLYRFSGAKRLPTQ